MCRSQCVLALVALFLGLAHSWDFALSVGDRLEFYTNKTKTDTVHFDSQNLTALVYDEVHNMLLYVNKQSNNDAICGYNISSVEYKCYIERSGRDIQGLAFDPITEILFFTDTKERSINSISFKPGSENTVNGNLLIKMADGIPTDIAVDSCRGYIYWINTNITTSSIERARFNGSEREIVINASYYNWDLHSLAIDQKTQKMYWIMPITSLDSYVYIADLIGNNQNTIVKYSIDVGDKMFVTYSNRLSISNEFLFMVSWCSTCSPRKVWKYSKPTIKANDYNSFLKVHTESPVGIVAKYKISEQIQGLQECTALTSLVSNNNMTDDSLKIAREHVEFCVHGIKVNGQSLCKCTPGYIGERCDVSVCENYCLRGDCYNEEGLPKCRCNAGYSGERCEFNVCHGYCSNNGSCSLNENEPVCQCVDDYAGDRCEVSDCVNYCLQGECSYNDEGLPKCRCNAGYSGGRCEVNVCHGYCSNNGSCFFNEKNEPVCQCVDDYAGDRCEVSDCVNYCLHGECSYNDEGLPICRCNAGYSGERCEVNMCHGYCSNNGSCSFNEKNEPVCQCVEDYAGDRCDVAVCLKNGDCSLNEEGSRCKTDKNNTLSSTPTYYKTERNLTLADLLANWQKPVTTSQVKPN